MWGEKCSGTRCVQGDVVFGHALCFFLYPWQLPKVLILQSASARAGADRTFSDQYLGELPGGEKEYMEREPLNADSCAYLTWCFERDGSSEWCVIGTESLLTTNGTQGVERIGCCTENALKRGDGAVEYNVAFSFSSFFKIWRETSRGFEPRSLDSESRVLTVTPRGRLPQKTSGSDCSLWKYTLGLVPLEEREHFERSHVLLHLLHISLGG